PLWNLKPLATQSPCFGSGYWACAATAQRNVRTNSRTRMGPPSRLSCGGRFQLEPGLRFALRLGDARAGALGRHRQLGREVRGHGLRAIVGELLERSVRDFRRFVQALQQRLVELAVGAAAADERERRVDAVHRLAARLAGVRGEAIERLIRVPLREQRLER